MNTILLVSHTAGIPGPVDKFYTFLKEKYHVIKIIHPISLDSKEQSMIDDGKKSFLFKIPSIFQYPLEGLYTNVVWFGKTKNRKSIDLAICFDSLAYLHTYLSKKILRIDKIVYYNVDYSKKRFSNFLMNSLYQAITKFSYITCDYFFSFKNKFVEEVDPKGKYASKQITVKPVIDLRSIKRPAKRKTNHLVYAGAIDYGTIDFRPLLQALKRLKEEKINFKLDIYGKANPESPIHNAIKELHLDDKVFYRGTRESRELTERIIPQYAIGLAAYATQSNAQAPDHSFMNKDLTGKLVDYIGAGLPIVSTRINDSFKMIDENKIGFSVVREDEWYDAIKTLLLNKTLYREYSKNALAFAKHYDADSVLTPIFSRLVERFEE